MPVLPSATAAPALPTASATVAPVLPSASATAAPALSPTASPTAAPAAATPTTDLVRPETRATAQASLAEPAGTSQPALPTAESRVVEGPDSAEQAPPPLPLAHRFTPQPDDLVTRVAPGVMHIQRVTDDPLRINILLFDLTAPEFDIKTGLGDDWLSGLTRTSYVVEQTGALAGINGDLFAWQGIPQGLTIVDSRVAIPPKHRATFAWSHDREPFIGYFTDSWSWTAEVLAPNDESYWISELNLPCAEDAICLYNEFARFVPEYWGDIKVLLSPSGRVVEITETEAQRISPGMRVLQGIGEGATWLLNNVEVGDTLAVPVQTNYPLSDYSQAISGGPIILEDGRFVQDCLCKLTDCSAVDSSEVEAGMRCEDFDTDWKISHYEWVYMPRTGVGYDRWKQTLIVAVVDGYQLGFSRGILQREFANLMQEFGAHTAMELDGGGSSTMVLQGEIVNNPSDQTGERYVANSLLFFWDEDYTPDIRYPQHARPPAWRAPALTPR
jgi:hypothetical protein